MKQILRRKKSDLIITAIISALAVIALLIVYITAPINHAHLSATGNTLSESSTPTTAPTSVKELWSADYSVPDTMTKPIIVDGVVISTQWDGSQSTVQGLDPAQGTVLWTYTRNLPICSLGAAWSAAVITYLANNGCGDVVSINAKEGTYKATRSAVSSTEVVPINSNDAVGTVSRERLELWRSDLVRTVEYGWVPAPQEPRKQPHSDCTINSALTRKSLVVLTNTCPSDNENETRFIAMKRAPSDSRAPETSADITIEGANAQIIGSGQTAAAVYIPPAEGEDKAIIVSISEDGTITKRSSVDISTAVAESLEQDALPYQPAVADLPHHITWFDGSRLYLFVPETMQLSRIFTSVVGTGAAMGDRVLLPTRRGIAVANWSTGEIDRIITIDRGDYPSGSPISLAVSGSTIIEKRGDKIIAFEAQFD